MLADLKGVPATPVMLLADRNGAFTESFRGYVPAEDLERLLADNHIVACSL